MPSMTMPTGAELEAAWRKAVAPYQHSVPWRSWLQVADSVLPYAGCWLGAWLLLDVSYTLAMLLCVLAAGFLVRVFIIHHDCGHGSFFRTQRANDVIGYLTGILTFTPYHQWRLEHATHHATSGNLDRRGTGDIYTMTVREYREAHGWKRLGYRFYRNPLVLFLLGPLVHFVILHRLPWRGKARRERWSIHGTNLALVALVGGLVLAMGWKAYLAIQIPILVVAFSCGVWLFYVQHQFEETYWEYHAHWSFTSAGLHGSTFYDLPAILQWFSGNIGFHHIHHLATKIPNYFLARCHRENPIFQQAKRITLGQSLTLIRYRLWDEDKHKMVGFSAARR